MSALLPDTSVTAISYDESTVFAYVQDSKGVLLECEGLLNSGKYEYDRKTDVVTRYRGSSLKPDAPKLFTPLAAGYIDGTRYLIYVDDNNYLHDAKLNSSNRWEAGTLRSLGIVVATYSKLAATVSPRSWQGEVLCVFYQSPERDGAIESVNKLKGQNWSKDKYRVVDPPLIGTSLTSVPTRKELQVDQDTPFQEWGMPVVYLQWDTLALAHFQTLRDGTHEGKNTIRAMEDLGLKFAPHTSLSAVDVTGGLQYFYTSADNNNVKRVITHDNRQHEFANLATPAPRSAIAAVKVKSDKVVLFYQALDKAKGQVYLHGLTLTYSSGSWDGNIDPSVGATKAAPEASQVDV